MSSDVMVHHQHTCEPIALSGSTAGVLHLALAALVAGCKRWHREQTHRNVLYCVST
jgi:hypothetical protein